MCVPEMGSIKLKLNKLQLLAFDCNYVFTFLTVMCVILTSGQINGLALNKCFSVNVHNDKHILFPDQIFSKSQSALN